MKRRNNRFLAGTLAGLMMLTMLPVTALAAEEGAADEITTLTAEDGAAVSGKPNISIVNVMNDVKDSQNAADTGANTGDSDTVDANPTAGNDGGGENGAPVGGSDGGENGAPVGGSDGGESGAPVSGSDAQPGGSGNEGEGGSETGGSTAEGGEQGGEGGSEGSSTADPAPAEKFTAKIGSVKYDTLLDAVTAAQDGDTIEIGKDIILDSGLSFDDKGTLTIKGAEDVNPTITLNGLGMWLNKTNVTFENINIVEESVTNNPADSGGTANLVSNSNLTLKNASLELNGPGNKTGGSGMYLYQESNFYVTNGSAVTVSGFNTGKVSGIYADNSEYDDMPNRDIQVTGHSSITITDCDWHGMTVNPIDILIDDYSKIDISDCGNDTYGGGLGCYYGGVTISDHSALITDDNRGSGWGVFANGMSIDSTSSLSACGNTGHGAVLAAKSNIASGATVTLNKNKGSGLRVYTGSNYWYGNVTIEEGADFTASGNEHGIEILGGGVLDMQDGTVTNNRSSSYGDGLYNRGGDAKIGGKAAIYNNHADTAGDDIYNCTYTTKSGTSY